MLTVVVTSEEPTPATTTTGESLIDEIVRDGARRMLAAALEAEVAAYIAAHTDQLDDHGRRLVVRNGHARSRQVLTSPGAVEVHAPRVNDKRVEEVTGRRRRFASVILLTWRRKSPKIWLADPSGNVVGAMHATTTPSGDPLRSSARSGRRPAVSAPGGIYPEQPHGSVSPHGRSAKSGGAVSDRGGGVRRRDEAAPQKGRRRGKTMLRSTLTTEPRRPGTRGDDLQMQYLVSVIDDKSNPGSTDRR
ncbi:transposase, partial [Streptosporangium canum]